MTDREKLHTLRQKITESLRVQKDNSTTNYIDVGTTIADVNARQNHAIFGRRGCGKTLLLHFSSRNLPADRCCIYLNCEDFKHHSFPNVLIEILVALLGELERNATGWFGRKRRIRELLEETLADLRELQIAPDISEADIRTAYEAGEEERTGVEATLGADQIGVKSIFGSLSSRSRRLERAYKERIQKIERLNLFLPRLKEKLREFFRLSSRVKFAFIQLDDLYHLKRADQAFVVDYLHRLCKDMPIYFKIATLRHNSTLFMDSLGQPIGAQERHDYQPIDVDYTFNNFAKTEAQNKKILYEFGRQAGMSAEEVDGMFKGEGFSRLVMAGGGVPRDVLSLFLQAQREVAGEVDQRIGKDTVRLLSREVFERRIEELKQDCKQEEQGALLRGIYVIRQFCNDRKTNIFLVREKDLQSVDEFRALIYRLLDYRIIHSCANALTHKSDRAGSFQAFAVDIGAYAHLRKLQDKFDEIDVSSATAREQMRSSPILEVSVVADYAKNTPDDILTKLLEEWRVAP